MIGLLGALSVALAARPDSGAGLYAFDDTDVIETLDGPAGVVRVHYSVDGPNETRAVDEDDDGLPDFAELVAETAEDVLTFYEGLGFRAPLGEADMGLPAYGGSYALDFYLVDFGGSADGHFSAEACEGAVCSGFVVMENDFTGYSYGSMAEGIRVLTSHELFHAIQAAYNASQPSWMSEGTAVWGEYLYDPDTDDFISLCNAYLLDAGRSLDRPPAGAGSSFNYGTALFWAFLSERYGTETGVLLQEEMAELSEDEALDAVFAVIEAAGSTMADEWTTFAAWNLATGRRAGEMESYWFAEELRGIQDTEEGSSIEDDNRFYPLATSYYRIDHAGGELFFATPEDPTGLAFALHPVADGDDDGAVSDAVATWMPVEAGTTSLGSLDAGGYWLVGTYPEAAPESVKVLFCLGDAEAVAACAPDEGETGDTGDTGGVPDDTGEPADSGVEKPGGCGCGGGGASVTLPALLALAGLAGTRRRRIAARV